MNLELVLINQDTGEPVYQSVMTKEEAEDPHLLFWHASAMFQALTLYRPRMPQMSRSTPDTSVVDVDGMGTSSKVADAEHVIDVEGLDGSVDLGY